MSGYINCWVRSRLMKLWKLRVCPSPRCPFYDGAHSFYFIYRCQGWAPANALAIWFHQADSILLSTRSFVLIQRSSWPLEASPGRFSTTMYVCRSHLNQAILSAFISIIKILCLLLLAWFGLLASFQCYSPWLHDDGLVVIKNHPSNGMDTSSCHNHLGSKV